MGSFLCVKRRTRQVAVGGAGGRAKVSHSHDYKEAFEKMFPKLVQDLIREGLNDPEISDGMKHLRKVLNYNVPGGKHNRGLMVIASLKHLTAHRELSQEEEKKALILGWCVEWLQAFFLVADDIMDQSKTRRGQPCWYLKEGVALAANDSFSLYFCTHKILRKYFRLDSYYVDILDLFHEITYQTGIGQSLDLLTSADNEVDLSRFTVDRYKTIVKFKTAYYSFYLPVALAMHMVGIRDEQTHAAAKTILLEMGEFYQIQDDFLDCFGDPAVTGKIGTDIEEKKCSWLVVQALARASPQQRQILQDNYGRKKQPECIECVKTLYQELCLEQLFQSYMKSSYQKLVGIIERETKKARLPRELFLEFASRIYKHVPKQ